MTSPTPGVSGTSGPNAAKSATSKDLASKNLGDKDTFLKLLVAQLKYQDPSKPADSTQFLAQTAQFTQVEKLTDIADLLKSQRLLGASGLVGRSVSYMDEMGAHQTGVISSAKLNGDSEPLLVIGNRDVQLSKVMEVLPTGPASPASPATGTAAQAPRTAAQAPRTAAQAPGTPAPAPGTAAPASGTAAPAVPKSTGAATTAPPAGPATT